MNLQPNSKSSLNKIAVSQQTVLNPLKNQSAIEISIQQKSISQLMDVILEPEGMFYRASNGTQIYIKKVNFRREDTEEKETCFDYAGLIKQDFQPDSMRLGICQKRLIHSYFLSFVFEDRLTGFQKTFNLDSPLKRTKHKFLVTGMPDLELISKLPALSQMALFDTIRKVWLSDLNEYNSDPTFGHTRVFPALELEEISTLNESYSGSIISQYSQLQTYFLKNFLPSFCSGVKKERLNKTKFEQIEEATHSVEKNRMLTAYATAKDINCERFNCKGNKCDYFKSWNETKDYQELKDKALARLELYSDQGVSNISKDISLQKVWSCKKTNLSGGFLDRLAMMKLGVVSNELLNNQDRYRIGSKKAYVFEKQKKNDKDCLKQIGWATVSARNKASLVLDFGYAKKRDIQASLCERKSSLIISDRTTRQWKKEDKEKLQSLNVCFH